MDTNAEGQGSAAEQVPAAAATPRRLLDGLALLALAVGGVLLLVLVGVSLWLTQSNRVGLDRAAHTRTVLSALNDVATGVVNAETGQRGYLLSGKADYLQPYDRAVARVPASLGEARREIDPALAPQMDRLQELVTAKMDELARTVALTRAGQRDAALALLQTDLGHNLMDQIQTVFQTLRSNQLAAFLGELEAVKRRGRAATFAEAASVLGVLAMAVAMAVSLRRFVASLREAQAALGRANTELGTLNAELEQRVGERTAELTDANEEIQRFAYIVSHDLRAPLVNIMGFTTELEAATGVIGRALADLSGSQPVPAEAREAVDSDLPEAIRFIKASTAKMDRLIAAILKLSREGRRTLTRERVDMRALLESVIDAVRHQLQAADGEVRIGSLPDIEGDRLMLEQIFSNLVDNAVKYRNPTRPLRLRLDGERRGGAAVYTVADNGRGIAERDRGRIFELFRRAGDQTVPGEGIGLAHVRAQVRRMGGRIEVDSAPDVGTTFLVYLPIKQARSRKGSE